MKDSTAGFLYEMAPTRELVCCQSRLKTTETNAAMFVELPPNAPHLDVINESEAHIDVSEEVLPRVTSPEKPNDPIEKPCT